MCSSLEDTALKALGHRPAPSEYYRIKVPTFEKDCSPYYVIKSLTPDFSKKLNIASVLVGDSLVPWKISQWMD